MKNNNILLISGVLFTTTIVISSQLPTENSTLFSGSGNCALCHSNSTDVFETTTGRDISPITLWRSTMMAHAAKDPLWQAKVTSEISANPELKTTIENKCNTCHTPMGKREATWLGIPYFSFEEAMEDPLSMDGVSCTVCHQIENDNLETPASYSGGYLITDARTITGPFPNPLTMPMINQLNYTPIEAAHLNASALCATCHTLITPYLDNEGNIAGLFPEQMPYIEWKNSIYNTPSSTCQACHMPHTFEEMKISSRPPWLETLRIPIGEHEFVGGNTLLLDIFKTHNEELELSASTQELDSTRKKTLSLLKSAITLTDTAFTIEDSLIIIVKIINHAGHKFPTGFPSRRAWIHLSVKHNNNLPIFESGQWNDEGFIKGNNPAFETHHDIIRSPDQVQIYETIMQDVNNEITYTLLHASSYAKDNRIPPKGYFAGGIDDTLIAVSGQAIYDANFNFTSSGTEGSGSDQVTYKIALPDNNRHFTITTSLCYQSVSPRFINDLLSYETPQVSTFEDLYEEVNNSPIILAQNTREIKQNFAAHQPPLSLAVYPVPITGHYFIEFTLLHFSRVTITLQPLLGNTPILLMQGIYSPGITRKSFDRTQLNLPSGPYIIILKTEDNQLGKNISIK